MKIQEALVTIHNLESGIEGLDVGLVASAGIAVGLAAAKHDDDNYASPIHAYTITEDLLSGLHTMAGSVSDTLTAVIYAMNVGGGLQHSMMAGGWGETPEDVFMLTVQMLKTLDDKAELMVDMALLLAGMDCDCPDHAEVGEEPVEEPALDEPLGHFPDAMVDAKRMLQGARELLTLPAKEAHVGLQALVSAFNAKYGQRGKYTTEQEALDAAGEALKD